MRYFVLDQIVFYRVSGNGQLDEDLMGWSLQLEGESLAHYFLIHLCVISDKHSSRKWEILTP